MNNTISLRFKATVNPKITPTNVPIKPIIVPSKTNIDTIKLY